MSKLRLAILIVVITTISIVCRTISNASYNFIEPSGDPLKEPVVIRVTCYTADEGAVCSTGVEPKQGIIAGCKEWEGMAAVLYTYEIRGGEAVPVECIGLYTVLDTGAGIDTDGDGQGDSIRNGKSIDVYCETGNEAEEWVARYGDYVLMYLIPEGEANGECF